MVSPKKGGPQRVTSKAKLPFASPSPKTKPDTHTSVAETDQAPLQGETETVPTTGWMASPGVMQGACWATIVLWAHTSWPSPHPASALRQPSCHLDQARDTKMDNNYGQGAQTYPCHGPRGAGSSPVRSCRLLSSQGLASNLPQPGLSPRPLPALPCREQELPCQGHLGEVRGETSAVKSCGWGKDRDPAPFRRGWELHGSLAVATSWCFGSSNLWDGTRLAPPPGPAWLPGSHVPTLVTGSQPKAGS